MIKLVACDLDGTLFNTDIEVSPKNVQAIQNAQANGIEFLIATGRSPQQARSALADFNLKTGFINLNGALVFDRHGQLQVKNILSVDRVKKICQILQNYHVYFEVVTAQHIYSKTVTNRLNYVTHRIEAMNPGISHEQAITKASNSNAMRNIVEVDNFNELLSDDNLEVMKLIAFDDNGPAAFTKIKADLTAVPDLAITSSSVTNIEINDSHAQKGVALLEYAKKQGIKPEEVAAIGDNLNDESMIRMAGVGVAMGNAIPAIKQIAQIETKSNSEDGVAAILDKFVTENSAVL